ncbi:MAG: class I SAM-dependent methyltransferase [Pseudomonadota bacterium]
MTGRETQSPADLSGASFMAAEVADLYVHRPPYAAGAFSFVLGNAPCRHRLLDLGCGEGKIARPMTRYFDQVVAIDPSANMIDLGTSLENGQAENLRWLCAKAEDAQLNGCFDLVTFGSSIHWMDPGRLFGRLMDHVAPEHLLAFLAGDEPYAPAWDADFQNFLSKWVPEVTGRPLGSVEWQSSRDKHLGHLDVIQSSDFVSDAVEQTVDSFVLCQHSRNTFALSKLGTRAPDFQRDLRNLLWDHADQRGMLSFRVKTNVTLARLKSDVS